MNYKFDLYEHLGQIKHYEYKDEEDGGNFLGDGFHNQHRW